jgi:protein-tyrosine-phosphatase
LRIFFVCEGNCCRSVIAEHIFKDKLNKKGITGVEVLSRGLDVRHFAASYYAIKVMKEDYGIDVSGHIPRELNKEEGKTADLILTMSEDQKQRAIYYGWAPPDKTFSLCAFVGEDNTDEIKDPYGYQDEEYRATAKKIERYLQMLVEKLFKKS